MTSNDYITFSVTAQAGHTLSLASLSTFEYRRSSTGPASGVLEYSLNNSTFTSVASFSYSSTASTGASLSAVDLSGIAGLQNLGAETTATFRLVNFGASTTSTAGTFYLFDVGNDVRVSDFAISGSVASASAVPEPSTYAAIFGSVALIGAVVHRRRRAITR